MTPFALSAILMSLVALASWLNAMTLKLPRGVAMLLVGLIGAVAVFGLEMFVPGLGISEVVAHIDFASTVTDYMLAFLLFAGAMQVDLAELRKRWASVGALATLGVGASILIVGCGLWLVAGAVGATLPLTWSLVFAALISPTDPVAVLATVRHVRLSKALTVTLQGEALFNDGVGIVAFYALLALASGTGDIDPTGAVLEVFIAALGGLVLGMVAAWAVIKAMATLDDFVVETSMSIALAMAVYAGAQALHLSGAIAAVGAGMLFGGPRARKAMEGETEVYLRHFWELVDEILNAVLFLLLGVELLAVPFRPRWLGLMAAAIPLVVAARFAVVLPWGTFYRRWRAQKGATAILGWGGLHGALSLALALSLPASPYRAIILAVTYAVVIFSIAVQGLSFAPLARRFQSAE
ncbi:MAG: cation:proton antiporter [Rhizomicrobium sp.]